jgi:outer membrane protein OmpA-like peptidoglycan-associated protein
MARSARTILAVFALVLTTAETAARDPSVAIDRSVIESLGPPLPAPRVPAGAPRAGGLPLAPDTIPTAAPTRRPAARPRPAPARRAARTADPSLPLPLPPEEPEEVPPLAAAEPLPVPPPVPDPPAVAVPALPTPPPAPPPPQVAAPAAPPASVPPPTVPGPAAGPPPVVPRPPPSPEVAARAPDPAPSAPPAASPAPVRSGPPPERLQLLFAPDSQDLSAAMRAELESLAAALPESDALRLTVNAYSGGDPANPSVARRASLSRALAVRTALMQAGVRSTRIDVRALGLNAGDGPPDRVDVFVGSPR